MFSRLATLFVVGGLAARALWLAWQYYFAGGPRYRVESAMIALVIIGSIIVALRRGDPHVDDAPDAAVPRWWLAVGVVAAPALYSGAIGLGFLSDDYTLRDGSPGGLFVSVLLADGRSFTERPIATTPPASPNP